MPQEKLTKVIATVGPSSEKKEVMRKLVESGANAFRFNLKHNYLKWHIQKIKLAKGLGVGIIVDIHESCEQSSLSSVLKTKPDFVALSFTQTGDDVSKLKHRLTGLKSKAGVIAKIENDKGLKNIKRIVSVADAIMIARGDLGRDIPMERLPYVQKEIIKECRKASKPVIVATEMLHSMVQNSAPTRAEVADVAGAIFDEADCLMLSEETAVGKHPVRAVKFMAKAAEFNEGEKESKAVEVEKPDQTHAIVQAAMAMLKEDSGIKVDKVMVFTETGYSARVISRYRPSIPVVALSENKSAVSGLRLSYGIESHYEDFPKGKFGYDSKFLKRIVSQGYVDKGDTVLVIHGRQWKDPGKTNALVLLEV
jgi:pyruvate kinase